MTSTNVIPKIVHLSYKSVATLPDHWKPTLDVWKQQGWQVMFHSDEDTEALMKNDYPQYYDTYSKFAHMIQKVDMVRICYLHKWGGVWSDLDLVPTRDLYPELQYDLSLIKSAIDPRMYTNMFMAGKAGHPFWIAYLDAIKHKAPWWALGKHLEVYFTTGPRLMNNVVKKFKKTHPELSIHTLPDDWIVCTVCNIGKCDGGVIKVVQGQSWNSWDSEVYNWLYCNLNTIIVVILILLVLFVIYRHHKQAKKQ